MILNVYLCDATYVVLLQRTLCVWRHTQTRAPLWALGSHLVAVVVVDAQGANYNLLLMFNPIFCIIFSTLKLVNMETSFHNFNMGRLYVEQLRRFELVFFQTDDITEKTQPEVIDLTLSEDASPELIDLTSPEKTPEVIDLTLSEDASPELIDLVTPEKRSMEIDEAEMIDLTSPKISPQAQQTSWGATVRRCLFNDSDDDRDTTAWNELKLFKNIFNVQFMYLCIK